MCETFPLKFLFFYRNMKLCSLNSFPLFQYNLTFVLLNILYVCTLTSEHCDTDPYPTLIGTGHMEHQYLHQ